MPETIAISGIDGSGKTTISAFLNDTLTLRGYRTTIVHLGGLGNAQSASDANKMSTFTGHIVFAKDMLHMLTLTLLNKDADILIFDRSLLDTIVKIAYKQDLVTLNNRYIAVHAMFKPKLSILLQTTSDISHDRDKDHPISYHDRKTNLYKNLPKEATTAIIDTSKQLSTVQKKVMTHIDQLFLPR